MVEAPSPLLIASVINASGKDRLPGALVGVYSQRSSMSAIAAKRLELFGQLVLANDAFCKLGYMLR
jgi:hypothetical protein